MIHSSIGRLVAALVVAAGAAMLAAPVDAPVVTTTLGAIRGDGADVRVYRGIPFAAPPVGELRWRPPQPPKAWDGVRDGTTFGADCMQARLMSRAPARSEDCLYLNVWTPARTADTRLPVMLWIYGGGFTGGSAASAVYDGERLARKGVVLVTANYRVGVFGFLAHRALTAESREHSSGNYGLLDQLAALRWVKANIAAFGGNPERVTIFGESAGASSLSALLVSPLAKGLFQRAILESPGSMRPLSTLADAERAGEIVGEDLGAMRRMPGVDLVKKNDEIVPAVRKLTAPRALGPIVDGWVVPAPERAAYAAGRVQAVPLIIGGNADEGIGFVRNWPIKTVDQFRKYVGENFGSLANEVVAAYGVKSDEDVLPALKYVFADTQFHYGIRGVARGMSKLQPNTYRYIFTRQAGDNGVQPSHGQEIEYVFGTLTAPSSARRSTMTATDRSVSAAMMDAWVRFAATADPNGGTLPTWRPYDTRTDDHLEFGATIVAGGHWREPYLDLVSRFLER